MVERIGTICVQGGWRPGDGQPRQVPIYQNSTWKYDTSEHMGRLFDLEESGYFYTRLANPTNDAVAAKIAELEGGCAAMLTSSGQAANFFAVFNIAGAGDHVVASSAIYGGTYNLLAHTMGRMGLECTFVDPHCTDEELAAAFRPNIKCVLAPTSSACPAASRTPPTSSPTSTRPLPLSSSRYRARQRVFVGADLGRPSAASAAALTRSTDDAATQGRPRSAPTER